jgi:AbrB family looped-hinge helix DNA binding protein
MASTRLSTKGQVIIPKPVRDAAGWRPGAELVVERRGDEVTLTPKRTRKRLTLDEVVGMLKYEGPPVSIDDMDRGIDEAMEERWARKSR